MATAPVNPENSDNAADLPAAEAAEAVTGHEVAEGTSEVAAHGGEGGGLPQFDTSYWGGQIVWLLLIFAVLYFLLARVFVPRLRKSLDLRASTISDALTGARAVQTEADAQAEAARKELADARASAQRTAADAKARADAESKARQAVEEETLAARFAEAEDRIRGMRDAAMGNVRGIAAEIAEAMTEKLSGRAAPRAEIDAALTSAGGTA
jgi:F-type H+-transporting ATPase subunit b